VRRCEYPEHHPNCDTKTTKISTPDLHDHEKFSRQAQISANHPVSNTRHTMHTLTRCLLLSLLLASPTLAEKSILLIAGPKSHGQGEHEHPAGCELLAQHLQGSNLGIKAEISLGWPQDTAKIAAADTLVIFSDGLADHVALGQLPALRQRLDAGKGLAVLHFALEPGDPELTKLLDDAIGGHFDPAWSVNPIWKMTAPIIAKHPATRGVLPFEIEDEFYFHLRLRPEITPLLQALPPVASLGTDGPRSGNPNVRKALEDQIPQTLAWVIENSNQARGFGFTGVHFHRNWTNENFRKLVLNAIVWTAGLEVPENGVTSNMSAPPAYQTIDESIARGTPEDVRAFLQAHPDSLQKGSRPTSRSPLEQAVLRNKQDTAILLLEAGAEPNVADASKRTPLHLAIDRNNAALITALLKAGAKPDLRDKDGWTPLHHAAAKNQLATAKALLAGGANPTTLSDLGGTPLHEAAASGGKEIIELLLATEIDPSIKSKQNVTALDIAKEYKNQPAIDVLEALR
jgi:hypothetical protein